MGRGGWITQGDVNNFRNKALVVGALVAAVLSPNHDSKVSKKNIAQVVLPTTHAAQSDYHPKPYLVIREPTGQVIVYERSGDSLIPIQKPHPDLIKAGEDITAGRIIYR